MISSILSRLAEKTGSPPRSRRRFFSSLSCATLTAIGLIRCLGRLSRGEPTIEDFGLPRFHSLAIRGFAIVISVAQLPPHNHPLNATTSAAETGSPTNGLLGTFRGPAYDSDGKADTQMESTSIGNTGGGQDHDNIQPYLYVNYIIAL